MGRRIPMGGGHLGDRRTPRCQARAGLYLDARRIPRWAGVNLDDRRGQA